jgi:hypothetical protein
MNLSLSGFIKRVLHSHVGHVLLAISWCFILFVMVRPSLNRPWFVDCRPTEQELFSYYAEVNHAYPIWTVIISIFHFPSFLLTQGVTFLLQKVISLSCRQTAKIEIAVLFLFSSIQWLLIGFGVESFVERMKSKKNHRRIQQTLGADSPVSDL